MEKWESYEQVATYLLDWFASEFSLERVEPKQEVAGLRSGTTWEIDAKGVKEGNSGIVLVECRRYTTSKQTQEKVASLAYRILDTGAQGGIVVSPLGIQEGGEKIAAVENIISVKLNENSTRHEYIMEFLNKVMVGVHDTVTATVSSSLTIEVIDKDGKVVQRAEGT